MTKDIFSVSLLGALVVAAATLAACAPPPRPKNDGPITKVTLDGPLIASRVTMVAAWEFPKNPLKDKSLDDKSKLSNDIRWGFKLFTETPKEAPQFVPGKMACTNCHLNGGQRDRALPLVGIAGMFPEYNRRSGRLYTLPDRVVDCFLRSQNATADGAHVDRAALPSTTSSPPQPVAPAPCEASPFTWTRPDIMFSATPTPACP